MFLNVLEMNFHFATLRSIFHFKWFWWRRKATTAAEGGARGHIAYGNGFLWMCLHNLSSLSTMHEEAEAAACRQAPETAAVVLCSKQLLCICSDEKQPSN